MTKGAPKQRNWELKFAFRLSVHTEEMSKTWQIHTYGLPNVFCKSEEMRKSWKKIYQIVCRLSNCIIWWNKNRKGHIFKIREKIEETVSMSGNIPLDFEFLCFFHSIQCTIFRIYLSVSWTNLNIPSIFCPISCE